MPCIRIARIFIVCEDAKDVLTCEKALNKQKKQQQRGVEGIFAFFYYLSHSRAQNFIAIHFWGDETFFFARRWKDFLLFSILFLRCHNLIWKREVVGRGRVLKRPNRGFLVEFLNFVEFFIFIWILVLFCKNFEFVSAN